MSAGTLYFDLVPTIRGLNRELTSQLVAPARESGVSAGKEIAAGITTEARKAGSGAGKVIEGEIVASTKGTGSAIARNISSGVTTGARTIGRKTGEGIKAGAVESSSSMPTSFMSRIGRGMATAGVGAGKRFGTSMKETAGEYIKTVGTAMVGFFAAEKGIEFVKGSVEAAREAQKANALTAAAIKSTGGAAHVSAEQVHGLAEELSKQTGIQGDTIQSTENLLLTFKGIKNTRTDKIFDDTTKAALDMSTAMKIDGRSAALQLGKALNDPATGMSKLQRVGVTFTDQQKKQAAAMVKAGDVAGAQGIILREVQSEFGGAAAAAATPAEKLSASWHDVQEQVGLKLIPVLNRLAAFATTTLIPDLIKMGTWIDKNRGWLIPLTGAVIGIVGAVKAWTAIQTILNTELEANPIGAVITGIALLAAGLIIAYKRSATFRAIVQAAFAVIKTTVLGTIRFFTGSFIPFFTHTIPGAFHTMTHGITAAWNATYAFVKRWGPAALAVLAPFIGIPLLIWQHWSTIKHYLSVAWNATYGFIKRWGPAALAVLVPFIGIPLVIWQHWSTIKGYIVRAWNAAYSWITGEWRSFKTWTGNIWSDIAGAATAAFRREISGLKNIWHGISGWFSDSWHGFSTWVGRIWGQITGKITGAFTGIPGKIAGAWGKIKGAFSSPINWIGQHVINAFIGAVQKIPGVSSVIHKLPQPLIANRATGGPLAAGQWSWVGEAGPELMRPLPGGGAEIVSNRNSMKMTGGRGPGQTNIPGYLFGGIIHGIKDIGSYTWKGAKEVGHGARVLSGTVVGGIVRGAEKAAQTAIHNVPGGEFFRDLADGVMGKVADSIENWIKGKGTKGASGNAKFTGSGNVKQWITDALNLMHMPLTFLNGISQLIGNESGGNPNAVNNWDINAKEGHPSKGLMQTIQSTFNAYVLPSLRGKSIFDPIANITAGVRYALANYGASMLMAGGRHVGNKYVGYDTGGVLTPGYHNVFNGTGGNELVFNQPQIAALAGALAGTGQNGIKPINIESFNVHDGTDVAMVMNRLAHTMTRVTS